MLLKNYLCLFFLIEPSSQPNSGNWEQPSSVQQMSVSEPFKRNEPKRRSITSSITSMGNKLSSFSFRGKINAGGQYYEIHFIFSFKII